MDFAVLLNIVLATALCGALVVIAVYDRINEGPVISLGLGLTAVGLACLTIIMSTTEADAPEPDTFRMMVNALALVQLGVITVIVGLFYRLRNDREARDAFSAITGWPALDEAASKPLTTNGDHHG